MTTRTRLTTDQKLRALTLLARGDTLSQVAGHLLEEFDVTITESALSQLRKGHADSIKKIQDTMAEAEAEDAEKILSRTRKMIGSRLARAERDENAIAELDRKYREGEIEYDEYKKQKTGLMRISITELNNLAKSTHAQIVRDRLSASPNDPALPAGASAGAGSTPAHLEALLRAIQSGNTVELQRLVFNPPAQPAAPIHAEVQQ